MWYECVVTAVYNQHGNRRYQRSYGVVINEALDVLGMLETYITAVKVCELTLLVNIARSHTLESLKVYNIYEGKPTLVREEGIGLAGMRIVENEEWDIAARINLNSHADGFKPLLVRGWRAGVVNDVEIPLESRLVLSASFSGLLSIAHTTGGRAAWGRLVDGIPRTVRGVYVSHRYVQLGEFYRRRWSNNKGGK